jgi:hypothetical protein
MRSRPAELPVVLHLAAPREVLEPQGAGGIELAALVERVSLYHRLGVGIVLDLGRLPAEVSAADAWATFARAVATRCQGRVRAYQVGVVDGEALAPAAFLLKRASVEIRGADPEAQVVLEGLARLPAERGKALFAEGIAPYVDAFAAGFDAEGREERALSALVGAEDPEATVFVRGVPLGDEAKEAVRAFLRWEFARLGGRTTLATYRAGASALSAVLRSGGALADTLFGEVVPLDPAAAQLTLAPVGEGVALDGVERRLLYNTRRFATYLVHWAESAPEGARLRVGLKEPGGRSPVVRDGLSGAAVAAEGFSWDRTTSLLSAVVPLSSTPLLVDFNYAAEEVQAARVDVTERALPPVGEIIFRHQQVQAAQEAVLRSYVASVRMEQHFRPNLTDSGYDVVTENLLFWDRQGTEWEELTFTLNGTKWGADRPPFPLLQPEKVLSLPLDLRLGADYSYELAGLDTVSDRECYVVRFSPLDPGRSLYRGTVWIDAESYHKVKLQAVQTRPGSPVQSNEETHSFSPAGAAAGRKLQLLTRLSVKQVVLIAGRNLLVEREARFDGYRVNPPDFEAVRSASRRGENVMYRDTEKGLRYYVKKDGERVVAEKPTSSAKALAVGTAYDPSYDFPLPLVGINYLDFDFVGKDSQLAVLFYGVLALVNVQRPQLIGSKVDASLDLFAIAVDSTDKVFDSEGEVEGERVKTRPFSTGLNLGWQLTPFQKLTATYNFRYDVYKTAPETAPDFVLPTSSATNGVGLSWEYRRGGYTLQASGFAYRRSSWDPWGAPPTGDVSDQRQYLKYQANLSKDFFAGIHKFRVNLAYFGGRHLDRFSMYQFGLFDETRIHGVPTGGVRFPELAMVRGTYSLNVLELYRLDLFLDQALGRDPSGSGAWRSITGLGLGFNLRGPFRTLVRGEVGKSFMPEVYSGAGSYNFQITFLKPI